MKKLICLFIMAMLVSGCATGYQRQGWTGGYSNLKIQDDIFKVRFRGNAHCGMDRAVDFTLLRCAEVALENGYRYFIIIDEQAGTRTSAYTTPVTAQTYGTANVYGNSNYAQGTYSGTTYYSGGQTYIFHKPRTSNTIKCFKEKPENIPTMVYDADQVKNNIKSQYGIR